MAPIKENQKEHTRILRMLLLQEAHLVEMKCSSSIQNGKLGTKSELWNRVAIKQLQVLRTVWMFSIFADWMDDCSFFKKSLKILEEFQRMNKPSFVQECGLLRVHQI